MTFNRPSRAGARLWADIHFSPAWEGEDSLKEGGRHSSPIFLYLSLAREKDLLVYREASFRKNLFLSDKKQNKGSSENFPAIEALTD